jgi:hypothetical protein
MNKELIFLEGFKGETLENVIQYWVLMNIETKEPINTITDLPKVKEAIEIIKTELKK